MGIKSMKPTLIFTNKKSVMFVILTSILMTMIFKPANAIAVYQLDVTYTNGALNSGPLSFGLTQLPTSVAATFMLDSGTVGLNSINFFASDVVSASVSFGDATWTESLLDNFSMSLAGGVTSLSYAFLPTTSATVEGPIVLNFPLSITGIDIATGQAIDYSYTQSSQTITSPVPLPSALWLFGSGLLGLVGVARRRKA